MSKKTNQEQPNTLVLDPEEGFGLEHVDKPKGRQWQYGKNTVYLMKRVNGTLEPVELPLKMGEPPEKLYRALFWDREVAVLFTLISPLLEKFKVIGMYVLIGILLLFIFLVISSV